MTQEKKWYQSQTKIGSVIIGIATILGTVGSWMTGAIGTPVAFQALVTEVGAVWLMFGLRDLPFVNKK